MERKQKKDAEKKKSKNRAGELREGRSADGEERMRVGRGIEVQKEKEKAEIKEKGNRKTGRG